MVYLHVLVIRAHDWQEKINLVIMDRQPTDDEKKEIIKDYWEQYEKGHFEDLDGFIEYLTTQPINSSDAYRSGIWVEKVGLLFNKDRLQSLILGG